eukprot:3933322-Karenia_brevis.AAC.1
MAMWYIETLKWCYTRLQRNAPGWQAPILAGIETTTNSLHAPTVQEIDPTVVSISNHACICNHDNWSGQSPHAPTAQEMAR